MATLAANIDAGWQFSTLTFVVTRDGTELGTAAATNAQLPSGLWKASATLDMSGFGSGQIEIALIDDTYNVAWTSTREIDSSGDFVTPVGTSVTLAAIQAKTDLIGSSLATVPVRYSGTTLQLFVGELQEVTITMSTDLSAKTLAIEFDDRDKASVETIADGDITKTSSTIAFDATATLTATPQTLTYSVRDTTTQEVYIYGKCSVDYQPIA